MTTIGFILDAGSTPAISTILNLDYLHKGNNMFKFIKNKFWLQHKEETKHRVTNDGIEKSLWDIKEIYDLETEEVERVVLEKREFSFLRNEKIQS